MSDFVRGIGNGRAVERAKIPVLDMDAFAQAIVAGVAGGERLSALFGLAGPSTGAQGGGVQLVAVLTDDSAGTLSIGLTQVGASYPALAPACPQAHLFEREIAEQYRVTPTGHPWLKPVRFAPPMRTMAADAAPAAAPIGVTDFYRVEGEQVHEVAVGPVHAGVIEPGHFRFQCHGENVMHLEISLGYQHRGVERALLGGPDARTIHYMETLAGDTTIGHASAYAQAMEALAGVTAPARAQVLRGVTLELERLANHIGDLGALAGDVGFLPTMSYCGRIRGDVLNLTALICGNRFGRGLVRPGGAGFDLDDSLCEQLLTRLDAVGNDARSAVELLWNAPSVMARLEGTGILTAETAAEIGLVGPAARACGLQRDIRKDLPTGIYRLAHLPVASSNTGDVFARAYVRWLEAQRSIAFVREQLQALPAGPVLTAPAQPAGGKLVVSLVEGWRGEICHVAMTDAAGRIERYKVVDPSFHNWFGLALAMRNQAVSDFPLCNKSFNLSYCGHDL